MIITMFDFFAFNPKGLKDVGGLPGMRIPLHPYTLPGAIFPTSWWNPGVTYKWAWRHHLYKQYNIDTISLVSFITGTASIDTANIDVIRQVTSAGNKANIMKPELASGSLARWGMNLLSADGDVWRKHKRIVAPAFNNRLYENVLAEVISTYKEMIGTAEWTKSVVDVPAVQRVTFQLGLLTIARCGFGLHFEWAAPPEAPDGTMSLHEAIRILTNDHLIEIFAPWLLNIPLPKFKKITAARNQLIDFLLEQIRERKVEIHGHVEGTRDRKANNVFTMLVEANENEDEKYRLSDQELIGNMYVMLFGGHETVAKSMAATFAFLALHPHIQEEVYQQIIAVIGPTADPRLEELNKLYKVRAAFFEAIRFYPAVISLIRKASTDIILTVPRPYGEEGTMSIPVTKGTWITCDLIGANYNSRHFEEPEEYRPSRWYDTSAESEAVFSFSLGGRACIGRKFATVEAVVFLAMLLRDWNIEPLLSKGDTLEGWRKQVFEGRFVLTLGVNEVPLRFSRRK